MTMRIPTFLLALVAGAGFGFTAQAQDLPQMQLKVIGLQSHLNSFKAGEKPFWEEQLPKDSGGRITAQLTAQDLAGLRGPEILRLMRLGVIDFASGVLTYMSGDTPAFEGVDLAVELRIRRHDLGSGQSVEDSGPRGERQDF